jgi:thiamine pyrophosphokinase
MKAIIVSGGKAPSRNLIQAEQENSKFIICADSGANCMYEYGLIPDYLLGDFDSIDENAYNYFLSKECSRINYPPEKDCTDTELALYKAIELGADEIVFLGCTGSRIDHILGNLGLLKVCLKTGIRGYIKDDNSNIFITDKSCEIVGTKGNIFSVQAYCDVVRKLSITGAKYPLENYDLELGDPITISNEFMEGKVSLKFQSGILMIIFSKD